MGRILKGKKSQAIEDIIYFCIAVFALSIGALLITYTYNEFMVQVNSTSILNESSDAMAAFEIGQTMNDKWDFLILSVVIGFAIAVVILGYFIDVHSVFMPLFILALIIGVVVAGVVSYTWDQLADTVKFTQIVEDRFPITDHIMGNLALYFTIIGALAMVATYAKSKGQGG